MKIQNCLLALTVTVCLLTGCAPTAAVTVETSTQAAPTTVDAAVPTGTAQENAVLFSDSGITASRLDGLEIDGTALTVTQPGTYSLSGQCSDGSVKVQKGTTGVTLVLNGLELCGGGTAAIVCAKSTQVTIEAAAGTENTLSDTESNNDETGSAEAENAVIKCKDGSQVTLCGTGRLNIQANGKNGIRSGASTQEEGDASLTVKNLTLNISAPVNDAVNAEAELHVESGTIAIEAGDDALHCDGALTVGADNTDGPAITISACYEGLEGATVDIYSGNISIQATDDCVNAANSQLTGYDFQLNIHGGTIIAYTTAGDGFDSNGSMTISGGTVAVWTASVSDNQPLDADGTVTISGGTVLAAGGSGGMGMNLNAVQPCVIFTAQTQSGMERAEKMVQAGLLTKDAAFSILDSQGKTLFDASAQCGAGFLLFSSGSLTEGEGCTLSSGGTETTGQVQAGSVSTGRGGMGGMGFRGDIPSDGGFRQDSGEKPDNRGFRPGTKPDEAEQNGGKNAST